MKSLFYLNLLFLFVLMFPGLLNAQQQENNDQGQITMTKVENQNIPGGDYKNIELKPGEPCEKCMEECLKDPNCKAYTYVKPGVQGPNAMCWLKSSVSNIVNDTNCISGVKEIKVELVKIADEPDISYHENIDIPGNNLRYFDLGKGETCQKCIEESMKEKKCVAYTFTKPGFQSPFGRCYLKTAANHLVENKNCISGIKVFKLNQMTMISKLTLSRPSDAPSFYASASTYLLAMQLSPGQSLWDKNTDSKDYNFHYNWAKQVDGNAIRSELTLKFDSMVNLKSRERASALANWYALVCETWANYGLDFGSAQANSKDAEFHKKWALQQSVSEIKNQINMRLDKILALYGITKAPVNQMGKTGSVATRCATYMKIPGLVIGMSDFAKDAGKFTPPDYVDLKKVFVYDIEGDQLAYAPTGWHRLNFYKVPSIDNDDPYIWSLPPGIVVGLSYSLSYDIEDDKVFGYKPFKGPESLGGDRFKKQNGGDRGAHEGEGWYWYESTGFGFSDWNMIECLPRGTVVGLKHSINQLGKKFIWQGVTYDPVNPGISPPRYFVRRHYGDMTAPANQGYYWYEKITDPPKN